MSAGPHLLLIYLLVTATFQDPAARDGAPDFLTPQERSRLARESKAEGRVGVYQAASQRYEATVTKLVAGEQLEALSSALAQWRLLLDTSLKDIEAGVVPGKKPKNVRRYEIHLRKVLSDMTRLKKTGTVEMFDALEAWCTRAEAVRQRIVDIMFAK